MTVDEMTALEELTGLELEEADYGGTNEEYMVFDIADERGGLYGDDAAQMTETDIQLRVRLHKETDYYSIKDAIWEYLEEELGCSSLSFESFCEKEDGRVFRYLLFEFVTVSQKGE